uniref:Uncharacterized protein n=1 Tax=viral metagenome TaxID=1070528 RepID=A0A6C0LPN4_9ZZZZ
MAYCIFRLNPGSPPSILDWNILNLMEEEAPKSYCDCYLKAKNKKTPAKICGKTAKYMKGSHYYCDKHAKTSDEYIIPSKQNAPAYFKKMKVNDLVNTCLQFHLINEGENFTKPVLLNKIIDYYEAKCFLPIQMKKKKSANDTDLIIIGKNMKILMNEITGIRDMTHVVIENQISPIANRMKTIQGMLAQYFIMNNTDIHIEFVSSVNKLKVSSGEPTVPPNAPSLPLGEDKNNETMNIEIDNKQRETHLENTFREPTKKPVIQNVNYKQHKKDGVEKCSLLLDQNIEFKKWKYVLETKKKDDLADCFLQGMWYINKYLQ